MTSKNLSLTLASVLAAGVLALIPAMAFADDDSTGNPDPSTQILTPAQVAMAQLQTDLQGLVSLSEPGAVATITALPDDNPTRLEASIATGDGSTAYDAQIDGDLIQTLTAQASMGSQFAAGMDASEVMTDAAAVLHDLQNNSIVGAIGSSAGTPTSTDGVAS